MNVSIIVTTLLVSCAGTFLVSLWFNEDRHSNFNYAMGISAMHSLFGGMLSLFIIFTILVAPGFLLLLGIVGVATLVMWEKSQ